MSKYFDCYYAMYLHHRGLKSSVRGENIIDAIKNSNKLAILVKIFDEDGTEYTIREHDKASPDKYFDYYWVDKDGKILYDEKEDKWGDYYREKKERKENKKRLKNLQPIIKDDLKVRVLAYDSKLIIVPYKPFEDINNGWFPVNDKEHIGSTLSNTKKNLGISKEALELMKKIKSGSDAIGDIDWYKQFNGEYIFSWLCALYRVIDLNNSVSARGFRIYENECVIVENIITDDMIDGIKKSNTQWKEPFSVTDNGIKKYIRKQKLEKLNVSI